MFCVNCGNALSRESYYCSNCGTAVYEVQELYFRSRNKFIKWIFVAVVAFINYTLIYAVLFPATHYQMDFSLYLVGIFTSFTLLGIASEETRRAYKDFSKMPRKRPSFLFLRWIGGQRCLPNHLSLIGCDS